MRVIKLALAVLVVAGIAGAVFWGANRGDSARAQTPPAPTVHVEDLVAQKSGLSVDTVRKLETAALAVAADKGLAKGTLSVSQAAVIRNLAVGPILDELLASTAQASGVPEADLFNGLANGSSLAQLAQARGTPPSVLKTKLAAALQAELTKLQGAGVLQPAQSAMISLGFTSNLDKIITATVPLKSAQHY